MRASRGNTPQAEEEEITTEDDSYEGGSVSSGSDSDEWMPDMDSSSESEECSSEGVSDSEAEAAAEDISRHIQTYPDMSGQFVEQRPQAGVKHVEHPPRRGVKVEQLNTC